MRETFSRGDDNVVVVVVLFVAELFGLVLVVVLEVDVAVAVEVVVVDDADEATGNDDVAAAPLIDAERVTVGADCCDELVAAVAVTAVGGGVAAANVGAVVDVEMPCASFECCCNDLTSRNTRSQPSNLHRNKPSSFSSTSFGIAE